MNKIKRTIIWILKPWPVLVPLLIGSIHYYIYYNSNADFTQINKYVSVAIKIIGACMVLININANLGVFKKGSILNIIFNYFKSFPLFMKKHTIYGSGIQSQASVGSPSIGIVKNKYSTLEERLSEIEKQLNNQFILINSIQNDLNRKIKENIENRLSELGQEINQVHSIIQDSMVGGLHWQMLGFSLVIYGACIDIW